MQQDTFLESIVKNIRNNMYKTVNAVSRPYTVPKNKLLVKFLNLQPRILAHKSFFRLLTLV